MLLAKIEEDIKAAMRARDQLRLSTLRMLKSAIGYYAIEKKLTLANDLSSDPAVVAVIQKQTNLRRDSIESYEKGGRPELVAKEKAELAFLQSYLPVALSDSELTALVDRAIADVGAKTKADLGKVMKEVLARSAGRADGKRVLSVVVNKLA